VGEKSKGSSAPRTDIKSQEGEKNHIPTLWKKSTGEKSGKRNGATHGRAGSTQNKRESRRETLVTGRPRTFKKSQGNRGRRHCSEKELQALEKNATEWKRKNVGRERNVWV